MRRNKRRHLGRRLQTYVRRHARRRNRQRPAAQPWHRRYRVHLVAALILGYAIIYCCLGVPLGEANSMRGQYNAIRNGMTVEEVEDILDKPNFSDLPEQKIWSRRRGVIVVDFESRRVCGKEFMPLEQPRRWPRPW